MLVAGTIGFECIIIGFLAGGGRSTIFNKEFLTTNFGDTHKKELGSLPPKQGYPDHGNGFYGDKLSYKDWFQFQLDQRAHKNFLEQVTVIVFSLLTAGIAFPMVTFILGCVYFVGRIIYTIGYKSSVKGRSVGAGLTLGPLFIVVSLAIYTTIRFIENIPTAAPGEEPEILI